MSRFRGPRLKVIRRFQQHLQASHVRLQSAARPPGQHGQSRRTKRSDYRIRLEEKQKLRYNYGLSERQLRNCFKKAVNGKDDTGLALLRQMESRLDNVVFRAGLAPTIPAARQLVAHGHVMVNGSKVDIPSFQVQIGQTVSIREKSQNIPVVAESVAAPVLECPSYLSVDSEVRSDLQGRACP